MLIIMRGTTLSGKSTICNELNDKSIVLSSDNFRCMLNGNQVTQKNNKNVFDLLRSVLEQRLKNMVDITIIDATNLKYKDVKLYIELAKQYNTDYYVYSITPPSLEILKERNIQRYISEGVVIPEYVIEKHYNNYHNNTHVFEEKLKYKFKEVDKIKCSYFIDLFLKKNIELKNDNVWVIGDVHNCYEELDEMCVEIRKKQKNADIILLGDWIDRGPSLIKTYEIIKKHNISSLMGNHEYKFIREYCFDDECRSTDRLNSINELKNQHVNMQKEILNFIKKSPLYKMIFYKGNWFLINHSGMNNFNMINNVYDCTMNTDVLNVFEDGEQFYGHRQWEYVDISEQLVNNTKNNYNIDSGCVYGNGLLGINIVTKEYIKIPSKKIYYRSKNRGNKKICQQK